LWEQYKRVIKERGAIVLTAQTPFDKVLGASNLQMMKYEWIWEKPNASGQLNAKKMPLKAHENILVFYKKLPTYNPQFEWKEPYTIQRTGYKGSENYGKQADHTTVSDGRRYPRSVNTFGRDKEKLHPTQKPVALFEYLIKTYTNEGDTVLDNVMGSGTTGVACKNLNRNFIGIELDEEYFKIAQSRIESS